MVIAAIFSYTTWLDPAKKRASDATFPLYWLTDIPSSIGSWFEDRFVSKQELLKENETLRTELMVHKRKLQQMASLVAENTRLRQLLNSADTLQDRVLVAELVGVSPNPTEVGWKGKNDMAAEGTMPGWL